MFSRLELLFGLAFFLASFVNRVADGRFGNWLAGPEEEIAPRGAWLVGSWSKKKKGVGGSSTGRGRSRGPASKSATWGERNRAIDLVARGGKVRHSYRPLPLR